MTSDIRKNLVDAYQSDIEAMIERYPAQEPNRAYYMCALGTARVALIKRPIVTKLGQAFAKDEYVLVLNESELSFPKTYTAWSHANACATAVQGWDLTFVGE